MPDEAQPLTRANQWQGMASNAEPRHLPAGAAQLQKNLQTIVPGRLTCRGGLQPTAFSAFKASSDVIGCYTYQVHGKDYVVYEATDGTDDGAGTIMAGEGSTLIELVTDYFNDAYRVSYAKSRHNSLIMVNGIDRGKMWDGTNVATGTITGITSATDYVITSAAHGLAVGNIIDITGIVASGGTMQADLNATGLSVAEVTTDTFTLRDGTSSGTYTSGGIWTTYRAVELGIDAPTVAPTTTLAASVAATVTDATNASPIVITTSAAHGYSTGQSVTVASVGGNTAANGAFIITVLTATTFELGGSTGNGSYTSGGTVVGGATAGDYVSYYRFVSRDAAPLYSNLSPVSEDTATADQEFNYSVFSTSFQTDRIDFVEIYRSTADQSTTVYLIKKIGHHGPIDSSESGAGSKIEFAVNKDHNIVVNANITVTGSSESTDNATHLITAITPTTVLTATAYSSDGFGGKWTLEGYDADQNSDAALNANAVTTPASALRILNPDGTLNANRHTVPPAHMSVAVQFQDRMFYAVPVKLDEGTCSTQANTTIDTFSEKINSTITNYTALVGRYITINDSSETRSFKITAQPSKTSLTIDRTALTNTDLQTYIIEAATTERRKVFYSEADLPESVPTVNDTIVQENTGDDDDMTGLMPHGSYLYGLFERHIYRMSFVRQPQLDIQWTLVASRGCFNQASWDRYADLAFLMDQSGPYILTIGAPIPKVIGEEIMDLWRECIIDFSKSKWFFTKVDPVLQVCRFHVCYKADNSTRPKRAICFHWPSGAWWEEGYPTELGGATTVAISGQLRTVVGAEDELLLLTHEGTTDRITAEIRGTVTSATSTVLTDSGASFGASPAQVGGTVAIVAGPGKGESRTITANDGTTLTTAAWEATLDTDSQYLVGAVEYEYKSSQFEFPISEDRDQRKLGVVFKPTRNASTLELRHYLDDQNIPRFGTFSASADDGNTIIQFTAPQNHGLIEGAKIAVLGSGQATDNVTHTVASVTATTVLTSTAFSGAYSAADFHWELVSSGLAELHTPGQKSGDGMEIDTVSKYPVIDMQISRSGLGNQAGFAQVGFSGNRPEGSQAARYITAEIHGFQGDDSIVISELSVGGAS